MMAANWYMAWAMLPRAIWLGSRPAFAGAATSMAINSAFFIPRKTGILAHFVLFGASLGAELGAAPPLRAMGAHVPPSSRRRSRAGAE